MLALLEQPLYCSEEAGEGSGLSSSCWWWGEVSGAISWGCSSLNGLSLVFQGGKRL